MLCGSMAMSSTASLDNNSAIIGTYSIIMPSQAPCGCAASVAARSQRGAGFARIALHIAVTIGRERCPGTTASRRLDNSDDGCEASYDVFEKSI